MSGTDDFNWVDARKEGSVIVPEQAAIAVYENENGDLVMRQESSFGEDDHYIYIQHAYLPRLIAALEQARLKKQRVPDDG
jgi:stringent starvation protein B